MRKITRIRLDAFLKRHASDARTLDIGSGGSGYDRYFPNRVTVDIDPARKPDIVADAEHLPFKDGEFPLILCTEVLEHVLNPRAAIAEMHRVLEPGGTLILTTRFVYPLHDTLHDTPHDYWRFTRYGMEELFRDWEIQELVPETTDAETIGVLIQRIGFQTRMRANKLSKALTFGLASLAHFGNKLIRTRYGEIQKRTPEEHLLASGYYLVARKPDHQ